MCWRTLALPPSSPSSSSSGHLGGEDESEAGGEEEEDAEDAAAVASDLFAFVKRSEASGLGHGSFWKTSVKMTGLSCALCCQVFGDQLRTVASFLSGHNELKVSSTKDRLAKSPPPGGSPGMLSSLSRWKTDDMSTSFSFSFTMSGEQNQIRSTFSPMRLSLLPLPVTFCLRRSFSSFSALMASLVALGAAGKAIMMMLILSRLP